MATGNTKKDAPTVEDLADQLDTLRGDLAHDVEGFMHERPATTIGLAVTFGFLVGMVTSRR